MEAKENNSGNFCEFFKQDLLKQKCAIIGSITRRNLLFVKSHIKEICD